MEFKRQAPVVLLDLDGTLHDSHAFWLAASRNAIREMVANGLGVRPDEAFQRLQEIYSENPNSMRHYNDLVASFGYGENPKIVSAGVKAFHDTKPGKLKPYRDVARFLKFLEKKEVPFYLVTGGLEIKQWDKLHHLGLAKFFNPGNVFCTGARIKRDEEIPHEKNTAFYQKVLEKTGAEPGNVIVIGDKEKADITPPKSLGALTVKILRGKYAREETGADHAVNSFGQAKRIIRERLRRR
ncbi:MAG: HAD family hydrolase [Candidatus Micrarchaeota archaeon]|nr:HAD family hydrolase [Candidatus Micrarchaeota archaeon]